MIDLTLLQLKTLWVIGKKPIHGYDLMEKLNVTQGTIYPLLRSLENNKLVNVSKKGRKKEYKITAKGKKMLKSYCIEFCKIYNDIFKEFVCKNCGVKQ